MEEINNVEVVPCTESEYLKPFRVLYNQVSYLFVSVLLFNTTSHCFVLVKQFRPAVYMCEWEKAKTKTSQGAEKAEEGDASESQEGQSAPAEESSPSSPWPPASAGVTYELCAGLVDKPDLSLEEIARQEVLEECGYDIPASKLKRITSFRLPIRVFFFSFLLSIWQTCTKTQHGSGNGNPQTILNGILLYSSLEKYSLLYLA
uniref:Nudix hydrolase domain-containing protein n=1 Tax=Poecilia mexicana TaxID=48701 RepID=A0A3B3WWX2_9TELE